MRSDYLARGVINRKEMMLTTKVAMIGFVTQVTGGTGLQGRIYSKMVKGVCMKIL